MKCFIFRVILTTAGPASVTTRPGTGTRRPASTASNYLTAEPKSSPTTSATLTPATWPTSGTRVQPFPTNLPRHLPMEEVPSTVDDVHVCDPYFVQCVNKKLFHNYLYQSAFLNLVTYLLPKTIPRVQTIPLN